jgi:hypothetical protein
MGRLIPAGTLAFEQLDFFVPAGTVNRMSGIPASGLQMWLFVNNQILSWPLVDGTATPDSSIVSGSVYFNEIAACPGFYSVRFFPDRVGFFRFVFLSQPYSVELIKEFDVLPPGVLRPSSGGLIPSTSSSNLRC